MSAQAVKISRKNWSLASRPRLSRSLKVIGTYTDVSGTSLPNNVSQKVLAYCVPFA